MSTASHSVDFVQAGQLVRQTPNLPLEHLPHVSRAAVECHETESLQEMAAKEGVSATAVWTTPERLGAVGLLTPLPWDSVQLGRPSGRIAAAYVEPDAPESVPAALFANLEQQMRGAGMRFADFHAHVAHRPLFAGAAAHGFRLMTTHLVMVWDLRDWQPPFGPTCDLRLAEESDLPALEDLAERAIPPFSRFAVDPILPPQAGATLFRAWAANSVRGYADAVDVAVVEGRLAGYCTWRKQAVDTADGKKEWGVLDLTGVDPEARDRGVFRSLAHRGLSRMAAQGIPFAQVITDVMNTGMQRACGLLGAKTLSARHTFHWHA